MLVLKDWMYRRSLDNTCWLFMTSSNSFCVHAVYFWCLLLLTTISAFPIYWATFLCSRRRIDRVEFERDYERSSFRDKPRSRRSNSRDRFYSDREREYDRGPVRSSRALPPPCVALPPQQWGGQRDVYYPEPPAPGYQTRYLILTVSKLVIKRLMHWFQSAVYCQLLVMGN